MSGDLDLHSLALSRSVSDGSDGYDYEEHANASSMSLDAATRGDRDSTNSPDMYAHGHGGMGNGMGNGMGAHGHDGFNGHMADPGTNGYESRAQRIARLSPAPPPAHGRRPGMGVPLAQRRRAIYDAFYDTDGGATTGESTESNGSMASSNGSSFDQLPGEHEQGLEHGHYGDGHHGGDGAYADAYMRGGAGGGVGGVEETPQQGPQGRAPTTNREQRGGPGVGAGAGGGKHPNPNKRRILSPTSVADTTDGSEVQVGVDGAEKAYNGPTGTSSPPSLKPDAHDGAMGVAYPMDGGYPTLSFSQPGYGAPSVGYHPHGTPHGYAVGMYGAHGPHGHGPHGGPHGFKRDHRSMAMHPAMHYVGGPGGPPPPPQPQSHVDMEILSLISTSLRTLKNTGSPANSPKFASAPKGQGGANATFGVMMPSCNEVNVNANANTNVNAVSEKPAARALPLGLGQPTDVAEEAPPPPPTVGKAEVEAEAEADAGPVESASTKRRRLSVLADAVMLAS